jgi:hypothetical protein
MAKRVEICDIEAMRRRVGVDDVELRDAIRGLRIGDGVRLTLLTGPDPAARKTVLVRVTGIRGPEFRGKLASPGPSGLRPGARLAFTAAHIHSLADEPPTHAE